MMKASLFAAALIVCISAAEALRCNRCVPPSVRCIATVEECRRIDEVCATVVLEFPRFTYFKRCMRTADAFILRSNSNFRVFTCATDRCN